MAHTLKIQRYTWLLITVKINSGISAFIVLCFWGVVTQYFRHRPGVQLTIC